MEIEVVPASLRDLTKDQRKPIVDVMMDIQESNGGYTIEDAYKLIIKAAAEVAERAGTLRG